MTYSRREDTESITLNYHSFFIYIKVLNQEKVAFLFPSSRIITLLYKNKNENA